MRIILIAGMPRSGSTWVFNVARCAAERRFRHVRAGWVEDIDLSGSPNVVLIKLHEADHRLLEVADKLLSSRRDLRDIAVSLRSMGWAAETETLLAAVAAARQMHEFWAPHADLDVEYGTIVETPVWVIRTIAEALDWEMSEHEARAILAELAALADAPSGREFHPVTLRHPRHITDGRAGRWREQLEPSLAETIWLRHVDWLRAGGYSRS